MKKLNLLIGIIISTIILSCSSNDNNQDETSKIISEFVLNQTKYLTSKGYIFEPKNSEQTIFLLNGKILNNEWLGKGCDYSNDLKHGIIFNEILSSENGLQSGTYKLTNPFPSEKSIANISIITNIVMSSNCIASGTEISSSTGQIVSGILNIEKEDNMYTLNYTIETSDFGTIKGTYLGELELTQDLSD
jgi:hypothetical protein|tara:strand:- start:46 stop:615 length:570 start_codon:yes stop_codon:yes gene_type:complete